MTTIKTSAEQKTQTVIENERQLVEASGQYMRGDLSLKDFQAAEREFMLDYSSATLELAKTRRRLIHLLERLFHPTFHTHS